MSRLCIRLLGPFHVTLGGKPVTTFRSSKVRALLSYLTVEAKHPHRREALAALFWPDWPDRAELANLRAALFNLRQAIEDSIATPPFLLSDRDAVQFNSASDHWLDVVTFEQQIAAGRDALSHKVNPVSAIYCLQSAADLYRGDFLEGFSADGCPGFEEWVVQKREQLRRRVLEALDQLTVMHEENGELGKAQSCAWRQLELDPPREEAHRQLMRLLALSGERSAALAQYETCVRVLAQELSVSPARETALLFESIRDGRLQAQTPKPVPLIEIVEPLFAREASTPVVGRERELSKLSAHLACALTGHGRVVFVTGETGSGKTALVKEFCRRAVESHRDVVTASGKCSTRAGGGEPYLPFLEIMETLIGYAPAEYAAGASIPKRTLPEQSAWPDVGNVLVEAGSSPISAIVDGASLMARSEGLALAEAVWNSMPDEPNGLASHPDHEWLRAGRLFGEVTFTVQTVARTHPLVLVLDDLQWADSGSLNLLFQLGRRLARCPILIIGVYRPEDIARIRNDERHPLESITNEFKRVFGDIEINLDTSDGRGFLEAFLDTEPNLLGPTFRDTLFRYTAGQPLFTVELLRGLQDRGDLVQDDAGRWVERQPMNWEELPPRVEAVIAERITRLPLAWQQILETASVEGEIFTAEILANHLGINESQVIHLMSGPLCRQLHLVSAHSVLRLESSGQRLSRYRFEHLMYQKYLYDRLDAVVRGHLHEAIGALLEKSYGAQASEIAMQLAWHFEAAGLTGKAVDYLLQAGNRAAGLGAYQEAVSLLRRGLALIETLPESPGRDHQERGFQLALSVSLAAIQRFGARELDGLPPCH